VLIVLSHASGTTPWHFFIDVVLVVHEHVARGIGLATVSLLLDKSRVETLTKVVITKIYGKSTFLKLKNGENLVLLHFSGLYGEHH